MAKAIFLNFFGMLPSAIFKQLIAKEYPEIDKNLKDYEAKAAKKALTLEQFLISEGIIDETALYTGAAKLYDVPYISIKGREIKKEILNLIPAVLAQNHNLIAFEKEDNTVSLAMLDPEDIETIEFVHRKTGLSPIVSLTSPSEIREAMRRYHADIAEDVIAQTNPDKLDSDDLKKAAQELPIVNIVNSILEHAVYEGASDIHIEPTEKEVTVRYRIDGLLKNVMSLPKAVQSGIMARIKILSNLKIDEHMIPQDGRFKTQVQDETLSFRVSIIPVYDGEKIVMRLLHESQKPLTLDQLGFLPGPKEAVANAIDKPHGMILVTGPTGSGLSPSLNICGVCIVEDTISTSDCAAFSKSLSVNCVCDTFNTQSTATDFIMRVTSPITLAFFSAYLYTYISAVSLSEAVACKYISTLRSSNGKPQ
jgi:type IV pilus assembly protein PilB